MERMFYKVRDGKTKEQAMLKERRMKVAEHKGVYKCSDGNR